MNAAGNRSSHRVSDIGGSVMLGRPAGITPTVARSSSRPNNATNIAPTTAHSIGPILVSGCELGLLMVVELSSQPMSGRLKNKNNSAVRPKLMAAGFTWRNCSAMPIKAALGLVVSSRVMPVKPGSWLIIMSTAAALTKPLITG